jgi:hypothetical protein
MKRQISKKNKGKEALFVPSKSSNINFKFTLNDIKSVVFQNLFQRYPCSNLQQMEHRDHHYKIKYHKEQKHPSNKTGTRTETTVVGQVFSSMHGGFRALFLNSTWVKEYQKSKKKPLNHCLSTKGQKLSTLNTLHQITSIHNLLI